MNSSSSPPHSPIRVGVIGASRAAGGWAIIAHLPAIRALPDYELAAVSTSRPESAKAADKALGVHAYHKAQRAGARHHDLDCA